MKPQKNRRKINVGKAPNEGVLAKKVRLDEIAERDKKLQLKELKASRKQIGERIKFMRESYGIERTKLSAQLGLAPNLVGQYERGVSSPQPLTLVRIAKKFNTTTDYLLCKTDDPSPTTENELTLDSLLNKVWVYKGVTLTDEEKAKLYSMIETGLSLMNK